MAEDFSALVAAQKETSRLVQEQIRQGMTADERAESDRIAEEKRQTASEAATRGWQTRQENATLQNQSIYHAQENEAEETSSFLGNILGFFKKDSNKSGAANAEEQSKIDAASKKQMTFLKGISTGILGLAKSAKEKIKGGFKGIGKFLFGAMLVGILAFLNSPKFEEVKNTLLKVIIPGLAFLYDEVIVPIASYIGGKLLDLFKSIKKAFEPGGGGIYDVLMENKVVILAISAYLLGFAKVWKIIKVTMKAIGFAIKLFDAEYRKQVLDNIKTHIKAMAQKAWKFMTAIPKMLLALSVSMYKNIAVPIGNMVKNAAGGVWKFMTAIPTMLLAMKAFFVGTMLPALSGMLASFIAMAVPLLPMVVIGLAIVAAVAAIALVIASLKNAFDDFMFELKATGSIWEATKSGILGFFSNLYGIPLDLIKSGISWLLEKIGGIFGIESFTNASSYLDSFSFVDMIADLMTTAGDYLSGLFGSMLDVLKNVGRKILKKVGLDSWSKSLFGTKEDDEAKKKAKEEEQKQFELNRKALREKQKLEKETEEAKKVEKLKIEQNALAPKAPAMNPIIASRMGMGASAGTNIVSAPTSVVNANRSSNTTTSTPVRQPNMVIGLLAAAG
jgi:hypothetical protein